MIDESTAPQHHENCGEVGEVGAAGELGTNAAPAGWVKPPAAPPAPEAAPPAPPAPQVAIAAALLAAGYTQEESEAMAESAVDQIVQRKGH